MNRQELEQLLWNEIPLAKAMGIRVLKADDLEMELRCPLATNHNHLGSAFGGSLSALMTLTAYCRIFHLLSGTGHVLLKSSTTEYFQQVNEELRAVCLRPEPKVIESFLKTFQKKGKARLTLTSEVLLNNGSVACRMVGEFVGRSE